MNLIIDVGNTKVKLAVFSKQKLVKKIAATHLNFNNKIDKLQKEYKNIKKGIIS